MKKIILMYENVTLTIMLAFSIIHLFSQDNKGTKDVGLIHFGDQAGKKQAKPASEISLIKIVQLSFLNGRFLIEDEHRINDYFSKKGGGGPTFYILDFKIARYIDDSYGKTTSSTIPWAQDIEDDYLDFDIRKQTLLAL